MSIDFCQPWGGGYWNTIEIKLNGVNITSEFSLDGTNQTTACDLIETWTATITLDEGIVNQTLLAKAVVGTYPNNYQGQDQVDYAIPAPARGVLVASAAGFKNVWSSSSNAQSFTIWNTGAISTVYSLTATCAAAAAAGSCTKSTSLVTLSSGESTTMTVSYTATSTVADTGLVTLVATDTMDTAIAASAWTDITVRAAPTTGVTITRALDNVSRGSCVTASLGPDVAMECGDLRITHALPATKTFGKTWVPTLIYSSQVAHPVPLVQGDITLPTSYTPTLVEGKVWFSSQVGYDSWATSDWASSGDARRIGLATDVSGFSTGLLNYALQVLTWKNGSEYDEFLLHADMAVVDRSGSNFGAGWWLAGLEELYVVDTLRRLWVGGDGSTRVYVRTTTSDTIFRAANFDRPDSVAYHSSTGGYTRWAPAKVKVAFNSSGLHVTTTNSLGQVTTFAYESGTRRLSTMSIPRKVSWALTYYFDYDGNGILWRVTAPWVDGSRQVLLDRSGSKISAITDPDGKSVSFTYSTGSDANRIASRTDRRGFVSTFTFDAANRLAKDSLNLGGSSYLKRLWRPAESADVGGAAMPLDSVYTQIDGRRTDVSDITKIWINQYGAPTRIRNAEGRETALKYDANWPGLVSETRSPSRLRSVVSYSSTTGLPAYTRVYRPLNTADSATTTYTWNTTWSAPTSIKGPTGVLDSISYNSTTGNREWQQTGGSSHRITYAYDSDGQLAKATAPGGIKDSITYDTLGNVRATIAAKGYRSFRFGNWIGQDTLVATPHGDTTHAASYDASYYTRVRTWYDFMGRDTASLTIGPNTYNSYTGTLYGDSLKLRVEHRYDAEGNDTMTVRRFWPPNVGGSGYQLDSKATYDGAGRTLTATSPGAGTKSFAYDPAGNVTSVTNGRSTTVYMQYDALNRLAKRITPGLSYSSVACSSLGLSFPYGCDYDLPTIGESVCLNADTATFAYDAAGNMTKANNRYARVSRAYLPNGLVSSDGLAIRAVHEPGDHECGSVIEGALYNGDEFSVHSYAMTNTYDLAGHRIQLDGPHTITGCSGVCTTIWSYSGATGMLDSVTAEIAGTTRFTYDDGFRLTEIEYPNGASDVSELDSLGRPKVRTVSSGSGTFIHDSLAYDAAGRIARGAIGYRNGGSYGLATNTYYGPLGAVVAAHGATTGAEGNPVTEQFTVDPMGNRSKTIQLNLKPSGFPDVNGIRYSSFDDYKRLTNVWRDTTGYYYNKNVEYDASGNVSTSIVKEFDYVNTTNIWDASISYYDAGDRLRVFNRAVGPYANDETVPGARNVFEEYVYDALGRRVLVRSRRTDSCNGSDYAECVSHVERTIWDGDQVIYEIRAKGGTGATISELEADGATYSSSDANALGRAAYVHAGGIDQPIVVFRMGIGDSTIRIFPHQNWRGVFELGTAHNGTLRSQTSGYPLIAWPGAEATLDGARPNYADGAVWFGGLIVNKSDGSGMQYMRNRYYDPSTGRFTQQDPIGLAGGMNLYGFASGDPVNFSDPMGLEAEKASDSSSEDPDPGLKAERACTRSVLMTEINFVVDVGSFLGYGAAGKLAVRALASEVKVGATALGANFMAIEGAALGKVKRDAVRTAASSRMAYSAALGSAGAQLSADAAMPREQGVRWSDFVPGVGTYQSGKRAWQACSGK